MHTPPLDPTPFHRGVPDHPAWGPVPSSPRVVEHVAVVIAAHDDERTVEAAVHAVRTAALNLPPGLTVDVVVVADSCSDRTAELALAAGAHVLVTSDADVGAARGLGCAWALDRSDTEDVTWLATIDADCAVPPSWLVQQVEVAASGVDLYLGAVAVPRADGARHRRWIPEHRRARGAQRDGGLGHVPGTNLGVRASTYVLAGGYADLCEDPDNDLVDRVVATGATARRAQVVAITTSGRRRARPAADTTRPRAA